MAVNINKTPINPPGDASQKAADAFAALSKSMNLTALGKTMPMPEVSQLSHPAVPFGEKSLSGSGKTYTVDFNETGGPKAAKHIFEVGELGVGEAKAVGGMVFTNLGSAQVQIEHPSGHTEVLAGSMSIGKPLEAQVQQMSQSTALVEELVNTHMKLKEIGAFELIDRLDELKKLVQSSAQPAPDDQELVLKAPSGTVVFSAVSKKTEISDKQKAIQTLGAEKWLELSTVSITELKKYLSPLELTTCTKFGKGSRSLKSIVPTN